MIGLGEKIGSPLGRRFFTVGFPHFMGNLKKNSAKPFKLNGIMG